MIGVPKMSPTRGAVSHHGWEIVVSRTVAPNCAAPSGRRSFDGSPPFGCIERMSTLAFIGVA